LFHFYTALATFDPEYGEMEIEDRERRRRLLLPYTLRTERDINRREQRFLQNLERARKNVHTLRLTPGAQRVPYYWRLLEALYD
jgi:hypothetical protein